MNSAGRRWGPLVAFGDRGGHALAGLCSSRPDLDRCATFGSANTFATVIVLAALILGSMLVSPSEPWFRTPLPALTGPQLPLVKKRPTAFILVTTECPMCQKYAPTFRRLHALASSKGIDFRLVFVDRANGETRRRFLRDFDLSMEALVDVDDVVRRGTRASVVPTAFVIRPDGRVAYRGRIDDRFPALGRSKPAPTREEFADAIRAVGAGKPVRVPETVAIGCALES